MDFLPFDAEVLFFIVRDLVVASGGRQIGVVNDHILQGDHNEALPGIEGEDQTGKDDRREKNVWNMDMSLRRGAEL